jgi:hypothetical protein
LLKGKGLGAGDIARQCSGICAGAKNGPEQT